MNKAPAFTPGLRLNSDLSLIRAGACRSWSRTCLCSVCRTRMSRDPRAEACRSWSRTCPCSVCRTRKSMLLQAPAEACRSWSRTYLCWSYRRNMSIRLLRVQVLLQVREPLPAEPAADLRTGKRNSFRRPSGPCRQPYPCP